MQKNFYTVDEIATQLEMHPKTVQRYIREGKIKATKLGKAWRVSSGDFNAFLSEQDLIPQSSQSSSIVQNAKVSSVIDIDVTDTNEAIRIANLLTATLNGPHQHGHTSLNIQFIEPENKLRIMLWGNIKFMETMLGLIGNHLESIKNTT